MKVGEQRSCNHIQALPMTIPVSGKGATKCLEWQKFCLMGMIKGFVVHLSKILFKQLCSATNSGVPMVFFFLPP